MSKMLILVVDDDSTIREVLTDLLEFEGHDVIVAENGKAALELLTGDGRLTEVILLDLMMPVCSGFEFLELVRNYHRLAQVPIVIMSAAVNAIETARKHKAKLIRKPLDSAELLEAIASVARPGSAV